MGVYDLRLTSEQFWALTPREFVALYERWELQVQREDRRVALIATIIANVNRDPKRRSKPFKLDDFMLHD